MLTYERIFDVFKQFLEENGIYEIVQTSHGYTILEWDARGKEWIGATLCSTPEEMAETLLDDLTGYLEYKATLGRRELTHDDISQVNAQRQTYLEKLR